MIFGILRRLPDADTESGEFLRLQLGHDRPQAVVRPRASALAHAQWIASGKPRAINMEGHRITIVNGYPDTESLSRALEDTAGFSRNASSTAVTYRKVGAPEPAQCAVMYEAATSSAPALVSAPLIMGC